MYPSFVMAKVDGVDAHVRTIFSSMRLLTILFFIIEFSIIWLKTEIRLLLTLLKERENGGWNVLSCAPQQPCIAIHKNYLAKWNGELISVLEGHLGQGVKIFKLDESSMTWRKVESLGDKMFFASLTMPFLATSGKQVSGMENNVFFQRFHGGNCVFYSLFTGRFDTFNSSFNDDYVYNTAEKMQCTLIEPCFETHSDDELVWNVIISDDSEDED